MKLTENYGEIFHVTDEEQNVKMLHSHQITGTDVSTQLGKYSEVKQDDIVIEKISQKMAILVASHEVKCQHLFTIRGRASSDEVDAPGRYKTDVVPLLDELLITRAAVASQITISYPTYDRNYLTIRKNGYIVKVAKLPAPPILTDLV